MSSISFYPFIKSFDCCSSTIGFTYNGKRRYKSFFGGILTILCLLIIVGIIIDILFNTDNFLRTSQTKYCNFMIDSNRDYVSSRGKNRYEFLLVNLLSSKKEQIINIHYMSLMDLFANVGSISNIIMILFTTLGNYTNHYFFQNDLIKVFSHEEQK